MFQRPGATVERLIFAAGAAATDASRAAGNGAAGEAAALEAGCGVIRGLCAPCSGEIEQAALALLDSSYGGEAGRAREKQRSGKQPSGLPIADGYGNGDSSDDDDSQAVGEGKMEAGCCGKKVRRQRRVWRGSGALTHPPTHPLTH